MPTRTTIVSCSLACLVFASAPGCSISNSVSKSAEWSSDSSGSASDSSKWSSESSSPEGDSASTGDGYRDDVREHTASFASSGGEPVELLASLAPVARRHGISNWEADPTSYRAIGEGLAAAGVGAEAFEAYRVALAGDDALRRGLMREGYAAPR